MKLFSQRYGFKPVKEVIQIDNVDETLRNRLWNALTMFYFGRLEQYLYIVGSDKNMRILLFMLWDKYFKKPLDNLNHWIRSNLPSTIYEEIKRYFFSCEWYEVYDFIEFIANHYPDEETNSKFIKYCNLVLEEEMSAYRFVGKTITRITSDTEISEIEEALKSTKDKFKPVYTHLETALKLLSNRESPDYRNSIKESILAVEAICKIILGAETEKITLRQALDRMEKEGIIKLHPALKGAFEKLYGYTSSADGIRHALFDEPNLSFNEAKFMLVACSAFVNYMIGKISEK